MCFNIHIHFCNGKYFFLHYTFSCKFPLNYTFWDTVKGFFEINKYHIYCLFAILLFSSIHHNIKMVSLVPLSGINPICISSSFTMCLYRISNILSITFMSCSIIYTLLLFLHNLTYLFYKLASSCSFFNFQAFFLTQIISHCILLLHLHFYTLSVIKILYHWSNNSSSFHEFQCFCNCFPEIFYLVFIFFSIHLSNAIIYFIQ